MKHAVCRSTQHPFSGKTTDQTRNPGIGHSTSVIDDPPQGMASHGLHNSVAIHSGSKSRAHSYHNRGIRDPGSQIPLRQNGIHHCVRLQLGNTGSLRVREHRDHTALQYKQRGFRCLRPFGIHILHLRFSMHNGLRKTDCSADGCGPRDLGHHHLDTASPQAQSNAGSNISGAPDHD